MGIACEVCGSVDVAKDDSGFFVCSDCGARYTIEAIREQLAKAGDTEAEQEEADSEPSFAYQYGDQKSDFVVEKFESSEYRLAANTWEKIESKTFELHPWVVFAGETSAQIIDKDNHIGGIHPSTPYISMTSKIENMPPQEGGNIIVKALGKAFSLSTDIITESVGQIARATNVREIERISAKMSGTHTGCGEFFHAALLDLCLLTAKGYKPSKSDMLHIDLAFGSLDEYQKTWIVEHAYKNIKKAHEGELGEADYPSTYIDGKSVAERIQAMRHLISQGEYALANDVANTIHSGNEDKQYYQEAYAYRKTYEFLRAQILDPYFKHTLSWAQKQINELYSIIATEGGRGLDELKNVVYFESLLMLAWMHLSKGQFNSKLIDIEQRYSKNGSPFYKETLTAIYEKDFDAYVAILEGNPELITYDNVANLRAKMKLARRIVGGTLSWPPSQEKVRTLWFDHARESESYQEAVKQQRDNTTETIRRVEIAIADKRTEAAQLKGILNYGKKKAATEELLKLQKRREDLIRQLNADDDSMINKEWEEMENYEYQA